MNGWKASILDDRFPRGHGRLVVWRPLLDGSTEIVLASGDRQIVGPGLAPDSEAAYLEVPWDALDAIRTAVDERLGRRTSDAVVEEVRASLQHERQRVDRLLDLVRPERRV